MIGIILGVILNIGLWNCARGDYFDRVGGGLECITWSLPSDFFVYQIWSKVFGSGSSIIHEGYSTFLLNMVVMCILGALIGWIVGKVKGKKTIGAEK